MGNYNKIISLFNNVERKPFQFKTHPGSCSNFLVRYIQWLFPVFESSGMNSMSAAVSKHEAKLIREDFYAAVRLLTSYRYNITRVIAMH